MSKMIARHQRKTNERNLRCQGGVASLTVVMVLFFILSLVAAYTSRNLIFEQRTAGNLHRSTQAFEAAEAGVEWALTMLNSGRIDATCAASTNVANDSFRQRYLTIDAASGGRPGRVLTAAFAAPVWPVAFSMVRPGTAVARSPTRPRWHLAGRDGHLPAFRIRFWRAAGARAGPHPPEVERLHAAGRRLPEVRRQPRPAAAMGAPR
ncbi:MAG: pilus assembly PilX N-terminal domain-containing protein [Betaproteobacteria bacterium]|nr:pilus assembly PilX N-terminal domain-containing protein [Betaproteobacteria bacterium]